MSNRKRREHRHDSILTAMEGEARCLVASGNVGLAACGQDILDRIARERHRVRIERHVWARLGQLPPFRNVGGRP